MIHRIYRLIFLLFVIAGSVRTFAQTPSSDVGIWIVQSELDETTLVDEVDLDSEFTWTIAGPHFHVTERVTLAGEVKYLSWEAMEQGASEKDAIAVNPLTLSVGLKVRF